MNIAIIGIGGIGGYIGSKLCKTFADEKEHIITFIQRGEHFKKIKNNGLKYFAKDEITVNPHHIYESTEQAGLFDLLIITVKSRDLEQTALSLQQNLHSKSIILTTLNGVSNAQRLKKALPNTCILNGCIYVSASIEQPGVVKQVGGAGDLLFGPEDGVIEPFLEIETILNKAGLKAILSSDITKAVWGKYLLISAWASISARYQLPIGAILADDSKRKELERLLHEITAIAKAKKVVFDENAIQKCMDRYAILPYENKTSMQLDIEAGKEPEIDIMTKYIVDCGTELGIDVPFHRTVLQLLGY